MLHQAQCLLAERDKGLLQQALEQDYPSAPLVCRCCGGMEFRCKTPLSSALATFLMLWLWSAPYPPAKADYCKQCGAKAP